MVAAPLSKIDRGSFKEILLQFQPLGNEEKYAASQASLHRVQAPYGEEFKAGNFSDQLPDGKPDHGGQQKCQ
jgi:hypothetical protein